MKKFTPIAMKCSQKDWDSVKDMIPKDINPFMIGKFKKHPYLVLFNDKTITNGTLSSRQNRIIYEKFNAKIFLEACGIEVEEKFEISKEQILEIYESDDYRMLLLKKFPEAFKKELEAGKWYKWIEDDISIKIKITEIDYQSNLIKGYGFRNDVYIEEKIFYSGVKNFKDAIENIIEATPQEVETALKNEAKKRGFKDGVYFIEPTNLISFNAKVILAKGNIEMYDKNSLRFSRSSSLIYKNGVFATIIETITKEEAEKLLNKKIV